jgi:hypothetical protein
LYNKFEPLLFLLNDYSESAIKRIEELARESKSKKSDPEKEPYIENPYFLSNTIYKLLLPLVIFKLMQKNLTLYDLNLVPAIAVQYAILKQIYLSFSSDIGIAKYEPKLDYKPYPNPSLSQIEQNPRKFKKQGIVIGDIDIIVESLLDGDTKDNIISYGRFVQKYFKDNSVNNELDRIKKLFERYDPELQPITWRILLMQYLLYKSIHRSYNLPKNQRKNMKVIYPISDDDRQRLNWFNYETDFPNPSLSETVSAVEAYVLTNPYIEDYCCDIFNSNKKSRVNHTTNKQEPTGAPL